MLTADLQSVPPTVQLPSPRVRHVSRLHDILTAGLLCVQPTFRLSSSSATPERPRQPSSQTSPSPRLSGIRPTDCPAENELGNTAVERDPYRLRIQLAVRSRNRRPYQLSAYSTQQIDAKGIVDFVRHRARFCDFFSEHCIISVKYVFLLVTNFLKLMSVLRP